MADIYNLSEFRALKNYLSSVIINDAFIQKRAIDDVNNIIGPIVVSLLRLRGVEDRATIHKFLMEILQLYSELLVLNEHDTIDKLNKALVSNSKIS
jgi:hypothetical protein